MVRPEEVPLKNAIGALRRHLFDIVDAGIAAVSGERLVTRALAGTPLGAELRGRALTLVAAGKVAEPMAVAFLSLYPRSVTAGLVAAPTGGEPTGPLERKRVGHPVPDTESVAAGRRALELAARSGAGDLLVVLLSGGASAALAVPVAGLTLDAKMQATRSLLAGGVAIDRINCVRKHLSAVKGGWLAAAAPGAVITLAVSDVVGPVPDDPAVIGSGPTAPDPTSFADALEVADASGVRATFPPTARLALVRGQRGLMPETPKPGDPRLDRSRVHVIGSRLDAMDAAARKAAGLGYHVETLTEPVTGEARVAGEAHVRRVAAVGAMLPRPACVVSAGETTVEVKGGGRGGRNQEFALAAAPLLGELFDRAALASVGTDGVDGPTDAAGAIVDTTTLVRAGGSGGSALRSYLDRNDAYPFLDRLGDLVRLGPTRANVGDLQVMLIE